MANINCTTTPLAPAESQGKLYSFAWTPLTFSGTDVGLPVAVHYALATDRSVQVHGTFGVGGTVLIEGSNDGTNWYTLTDPQGNALSVTAAKIEAISEPTVYVRPRVTAGDGTTSLTVTIFARI